MNYKRMSAEMARATGVHREQFTEGRWRTRVILEDELCVAQFLGMVVAETSVESSRVATGWSCSSG